MHFRPVCARPGCQGQTAAWLTYDYELQHVWLDDAPAGDGGNQWALCSGHAGGLRVPRGWTQVDRRAGPAADPFAEPVADPVLLS